MGLATLLRCDYEHEHEHGGGGIMRSPEGAADVSPTPLWHGRLAHVVFCVAPKGRQMLAQGGALGVAVATYVLLQYRWRNRTK